MVACSYHSKYLIYIFFHFKILGWRHFVFVFHSIFIILAAWLWVIISVKSGEACTPRGLSGSLQSVPLWTGFNVGLDSTRRPPRNVPVKSVSLREQWNPDIRIQRRDTSLSHNNQLPSGKLGASFDFTEWTSVLPLQSLYSAKKVHLQSYTHPHRSLYNSLFA